MPRPELKMTAISPKPKRHSKRPAQPIREPLREAIKKDGRSFHALFRATGIGHATITRFFRRMGQMYLKTADKFCLELGLQVVGELNGTVEVPWGTPTQVLRALIGKDERTPYELARRLGIHAGTVVSFVRSGGGLKVPTAETLFIEYGLRLAPGPRVSDAKPDQEDRDRPRPIAAPVIEAIASDGRTTRKLAKDAGIDAWSVRNFFLGKADLRVSTIDRLLIPLGLQVIAELTGSGTETPGEAPQQSIEAALRKCHNADSRTLCDLDRATGITYTTLGKFFHGYCGMLVATAETLFIEYGLRLAPGSKPYRPQRRPKTIPFSPFTLREKFHADGWTVPNLARYSRVSMNTIYSVLKGHDALKPATCLKLAIALGLEPDPAKIPGRLRCPVVLQGEGLPIVVGGKSLPGMRGDAYEMLRRLVDGFDQGRRVPASELADLSEAGRIRPLTEALDRHGFGLLKRLIRESKVGRCKFLEIIEVCPGD